MFTRFGTIIVLVVVLTLGMMLYRGWQSMERAGYESCLASINSAVDSAVRYDREYLDIIWAMLPADGAWTIFRGNEIDPIMSKISPGDCSKTKDKTLDIWGNKISIGLRRVADKVETRTWSNGPDGAEGTADDVVMPWREQVPQ